MAEYVKFSHNRLLVGLRRRDWAPVWYQPYLEGDVRPNEDGDAPIALYQVAKGGPQPREPLEAETAWFPLYHIDNFQASGVGKMMAKKVLQQRYLWDCWRYMFERDPAKIAGLEQELENPNDRQWQAWFNVAKKEKRKQTTARAARRVTRSSRASEFAQATGQNVADIEVNSDSSDDSGFESDEETRMLSRKTEMAPPRRQPASRGTKRSGPGGGANGRNGGAKKKKGLQGRGGSNDSPPPVARRGGARPRPGGGSGSAAIPIDDDDEDDDTSALGFDPRRPERPSLPRSTGTGLFVSGPPNDLDGREYLLGRMDSTYGTFSQDNRTREGSVMRDDDWTNNGMNDEEALRRAIEASVEPEANPLNHGGPSEEEAPRRTIEQSLEPPERPHRTPE